ncbi:CoA isomerase (plasmid) [Paraburkholderia sp. PGU19]|uniref:enoyl-CoA hydratase/isomerase family protein n=1 Tax=Paraburkholderia sp. PGU19 TaxID=2735434 RepID=UPI0015DB5176|nr:enoyl-CoA hydratase-related protein [Paraburkholderia sp. PGU19]BCG05674.1 CoA isomerase [Paraburkholderia sp. PGU19]
MLEYVKFTVNDRIATITLDRPEARNALNPELTGELIQKIRLASADPQAKCILIQAEGESFCAGGDVKGFSELLHLSSERRFDAFEQKLLVGNRLPKVILESPKPIVVATRGAVAGAGLSLCLAADFVISAESTYFIAAHILVGLSLDCGLSGMLTAAMGIKTAKRLALLGERFGAKEAMDLGIVTQVVSETDLQDVTQKLVRRLSAGPATAMAKTKDLLNHAVYRSLNDQLAEEATAIAECAATEDFRKGIEAALGKQRRDFD